MSFNRLETRNWNGVCDPRRCRWQMMTNKMCCMRVFVCVCNYYVDGPGINIFTIRCQCSGFWVGPVLDLNVTVFPMMPSMMMAPRCVRCWQFVRCGFRVFNWLDLITFTHKNITHTHTNTLLLIIFLMIRAVLSVVLVSRCFACG